MYAKIPPCPTAESRCRGFSGGHSSSESHTNPGGTPDRRLCVNAFLQRKKKTKGPNSVGETAVEVVVLGGRA